MIKVNWNYDKKIPIRSHNIIGMTIHLFYYFRYCGKGWWAKVDLDRHTTIDTMSWWLKNLIAGCAGFTGLVLHCVSHQDAIRNFRKIYLSLHLWNETDHIIYSIVEYYRVYYNMTQKLYIIIWSLEICLNEKELLNL